jgi:hypothetical protein
MVANAYLRTGVHLPLPKNAPSIFHATRLAPFLEETITDLLNQKILIPYQNIKNAFRMYLVAKPSGAARPVVDLSPWTQYYSPPPIRLYSAADILSTIPPRARM